MEFAVSASVLFLLIVAAVEFSRVNMMRHSVDNAAYEGARRAIVPGATAADAEDTAQRIMSVVGTRNVSVEVEPDVIQNSTPDVTVTVSVPVAGNGFLAPHFFRGKSLVGKCQLIREEL